MTHEEAEALAVRLTEALRRTTRRLNAQVKCHSDVEYGVPIHDVAIYLDFNVNGEMYHTMWHETGALLERMTDEALDKKLRWCVAHALSQLVDAAFIVPGAP